MLLGCVIAYAVHRAPDLFYPGGLSTHAPLSDQDRAFWFTLCVVVPAVFYAVVAVGSLPAVFYWGAQRQALGATFALLLLVAAGLGMSRCLALFAELYPYLYYCVWFG